MKLKICGMKYQDNIQAVATLQPDYLGFIFYDKSARAFNGTIPEISEQIKKTGVFVNASIEDIISKIKQYDLKAIQLHGKESPEFCELLKARISTPLNASVEIIKVFSIKNEFNFSVLEAYESVCDYYLFDTKGALPGGNGYTFDWNVLANYPSQKPFFLSGGIGIHEVENIKSFLQQPASTYCYALDVNSKFEIVPGLKNIEDLKAFKDAII